MKENVFAIVLLSTAVVLLIVMNIIFWQDAYNFKFVIYGSIFGFFSGALFVLGLVLIRTKKGA